MPNPPGHESNEAPDLLPDELRQRVEDMKQQLMKGRDPEIERLRAAAEHAEEIRDNISEIETLASVHLQTINELQIGASRAVLIGSHSNTAGVEREAQVRWRNITMFPWVTLIAAAVGAAFVTIALPPASLSWEYLLTRGPFGALFITLGLAIRYTSNRAEDHRIQELVMTNVALSMRSAEGFANAIDRAQILDSQSNQPSQEFLADISKTLFVSPIDSLLRRGDAKWTQRPRSGLPRDTDS